jgi:hypothetical protein
MIKVHLVSENGNNLSPYARLLIDVYQRKKKIIKTLIA